MGMIFCYSPKMTDEEIKEDIQRRLRIRQEAGLPPLSIEDETARLVSAREEAEFQRWYKSHPDRYVNNPKLNVLSNMGLYYVRQNALRKKFRAERGY